jgi:hypothetical protein
MLGFKADRKRTDAAGAGIVTEITGPRLGLSGERSTGMRVSFGQSQPFHQADPSFEQDTGRR